MSAQFEVADQPLANPLLTQPVGLMIRKIGLPVSIGAFFNTMFNVVDTYYGGQISSQALAALSLSFPIFFIIVALGFGLGTGNTALIGNALGAGQKSDARRFAVQGIVIGLLLSLVVTVIGLMSAPVLFRWMGAADDYLAMSLRYINTIFYGTILFVTVQMFNSVLNALGQTKAYRNLLIAGFLLNLVLDPWFLYGGFGLPAMGIRGIATATLLVQALTGLCLGYIAFRTELLSMRGARQYLRLQPAVVVQILRQGLPNIVDLGSISIGFFILNYFVGRFGQDAIAAFGAAARIEQVALLPMIGLDVASLSLVAQNNGARFFPRVRATMMTATGYGLLLMIFGGLVIVTFAHQLMGLFSNDIDVIGMGVRYIRIRAWGLLPFALSFVALATLRGLKFPVHALAFSMARMVVLPTLAIFTLGLLFDYPLEAIWWVMLVILFGVGIGAFVYARSKLPSD